MHRARLFHHLIYTILLSLFINSYYIFAHVEAIAVDGTSKYLRYGGLLWIILILYIAIIIVILLNVKYYSAFNKLVLILECSVLYYSGFAICQSIGDYYWRNAFYALADRGNIIIAALNRYADSRGNYPFKLSDLVPEYLPEIPTTGMAAYRFTYKLLFDTNVSWHDKLFNLSVTVSPSGRFIYSTLYFIYCPKHIIKDDVEHIILERYGDWIFIS